MLFPLTEEAQKGKLNSIVPEIITDKKTVEQIRRDDKNIPKRKDMVDIKERIIEKDKKELDKEKEKLADQISTYFVPVVVGLAILTFIGWVLIGEVSWSRGMINAVAVLVIACPCALGLATPTAIMVGATKGAENGILFRNSEALERAGRVQVVILDKTGTITRGEPAVTDLLPSADITTEELLRFAACAERGSEHPLGRAIVNAATEKGLHLVDPDQFTSISGFGIRAIVENQAFVIGNPRLMKNEGISIDHLQDEMDRLQSEGKTAMLIARKPVEGEEYPRS
jgi:Cu+-exporting ATPase